MKRLILFGGLALAGGALAIRSAEMPAETWHVDPTRAVRSGNPNDYLLGPGGDGPPLTSTLAPPALATRLDVVALAEPRTERIAGDPANGFVTYVQRSAVMGFPDAISVRVEPEGAGSRLSIWSRSRFGKGDLGVNRRRVERWLAALDPALRARMGPRHEQGVGEFQAVNRPARGKPVPAVVSTASDGPCAPCRSPSPIRPTASDPRP